MTFDRDMNQKSVKNSSSCFQDFSVQALSIYLIFFCLKEHVRMQGIKVLFFKFLLFLEEKGDHKFNGSKDATKMGV